MGFWLTPPIEFFWYSILKKNFIFFVLAKNICLWNLYHFFAYYPTYRDIWQKSAYEGPKKCIFLGKTTRFPLENAYNLFF